MGDHHHGFACVFLCQRLDAVADALQVLVQAFAARQDVVGDAFAQGTGVLGVMCHHFAAYHAFAAAVVPFAQGGKPGDREIQRRRNRFGRLPGALQVAAIKRCGRLPDKQARGLGGLFQSFPAEREILVALHALFGVPGGFSVADQAEAHRLFAHESCDVKNVSLPTVSKACGEDGS